MVFEGHKTVREGRKDGFHQTVSRPSRHSQFKKPQCRRHFSWYAREFFSSVLSVYILSFVLYPRGASRLMRRRSGERHGIDAALHEIFELATLRATVFAEEDRSKFTQAKWSGGGFRHFRDPKVVCIEHFRPKPQARSLSLRSRPAYLSFILANEVVEAQQLAPGGLCKIRALRRTEAVL